MGANQIEGLFVAAVATALGVVILFVDPRHLPDPIRSWGRRLGRFRHALGAGCVVVGLLNAAMALGGRW